MHSSADASSALKLPAAHAVTPVPDPVYPAFAKQSDIQPAPSREVLLFAGHLVHGTVVFKGDDLNVPIKQFTHVIAAVTGFLPVVPNAQPQYFLSKLYISSTRAGAFGCMAQWLSSSCDPSPVTNGRASLNLHGKGSSIVSLFFTRELSPRSLPGRSLQKLEGTLPDNWL